MPAPCPACVPFTSPRPSSAAIKIYFDTIIGLRRTQSFTELTRSPGSPYTRLERGPHELFVAINPEHPLPRAYQHVPAINVRNLRVYVSTPHWMERRPEAAHWQSLSNRSGALYPAAADLRRSGNIPGCLLLQLLIATEHDTCLTSRHYHRHTIERFHQIGSSLGSNVEFMNGTSRVWHTLPPQLDIPPGCVHQLRLARPGIAINLLEMYGPAGLQRCPTTKQLVYDMSDHFYEEISLPEHVPSVVP